MEIVHVRNGPKIGAISAWASILVVLVLNLIGTAFWAGGIKRDVAAQRQQIGVLLDIVNRIEKRDDDMTERLTRLEQMLEDHIRATSR